MPMNAKKTSKEILNRIEIELAGKQEHEILKALQELKTLYIDSKVTNLLIELLDHRLWKVRKEVAAYLSNKVKNVFPQLIQQLDNPSPHVRYWLYQILPHAGVQSARHLQKVYSQMELQEKLFILESLAKIADPNSIDFALDCLNDPLWSVRNEASKILLGMRQKSVNPLKEIIREGSDHQRYWAFKILGKMSGESALETFDSILNNSGYEEKIRSYALSGIQEIESSSTIPVLITTLESDLWALRAQAAKILINHKHAPHKLILDAMITGSKTIKYWGFQILKNIVEDKHLCLLEEALDSPDFDLKFQAIGLISQVKSNSSAQILSHNLNDETWYIRKHCADGLVNLGYLSIPVLGKNLVDRPPEEIFWICRVFRRLAHTSCLPYLEKLIQHQDKQIRLYAIEALGSIGGARAAELLIKAFDNEFWIVRSKAHEALLNLGINSILPLLSQLRSPNDSILYWSQRTLEENPYYGARTLMSFLSSTTERQFNETLEQLSMLNTQGLHELVQNDNLQTKDILHAIQKTANLAISSQYKSTTDNPRINFFQHSEFSYEKQQFFNEILKDTVNSEATQLIFKSDHPPIMRIDGVLCKSGERKLSNNEIQEFFTEVLSEDHTTLFKQQGYCKVSLPFNSEVQFNVHLSSSNSGIQANLAPRKLTIPGFENLKLPQEFLSHICKLPRGLIFVSGSKSTGKTSLIHAMLSQINRHYVKHILCVEDQTSLQLQSDKSLISYKTIGRDLNSYEEAVKASLSEDCDVIYLAKLPHYPALETVLELASSKCLVILECNAPSTVEALQKLLLGFPEQQIKVYEKLLQAALQVSIHTKLLNNIEEGGFIPALEYFLVNSKLTEKLTMTDLESMINLLQKSKHKFTVTMDDYLLELASSKKISYQEAVRWMKDKSKLSVDQIW